MKQVVMTFATVKQDGTADGGSLDVTFSVDASANPKNSITHFQLNGSGGDFAGAPPLKFNLIWNDAAELEQTINTILSNNPVPATP